MEKNLSKPKASPRSEFAELVEALDSGASSKSLAADPPPGLFRLKPNCLLTREPIVVVMPAWTKVVSNLRLRYLVWQLRRHGYQVLTTNKAPLAPAHLILTELSALPPAEYSSLSLLEMNKSPVQPVEYPKMATPSLHLTWTSGPAILDALLLRLSQLAEEDFKKGLKG